MFHIQHNTKDFGCIMGYALKWLKMYFSLCYMVFNTFQQNWKIFIHSVYLSVPPSVHDLTYSSDVFKFMHAVHIWYIMGSIENDTHWIMCSFTETHESFPMHFSLSGKDMKFLILIVAYLYCPKYNEIKYFL